MSWLVVFAVLAALAGPTPTLAQTNNAQELRISWDVAAVASTGARTQSSSGDTLQVLERTRGVVYAPRQRRPEIAAGQIVVTVVDAAGREKGRTIVPDPRILRAELPDETGRLHAAEPSGEVGGELVQPNPEFVVTLPDDPSVRELRIHEPRWNGSEFELDLIAVVELD